jgi:uncharacterized protein YndB with AHSA1/START domain
MAEYATSIEISAAPEVVFQHLTTADGMRAWMGQHASLDPVAGGEFTVDINGSPVRGAYLEVDPPHRVVVSWGIAGDDEHPPGSSRVEFTLTEISGGTRLELLHSDLPETRANRHGTGWEHFLARLDAATHYENLVEEQLKLGVTLGRALQNEVLDGRRQDLRHAEVRPACGQTAHVPVR